MAVQENHKEDKLQAQKIAAFRDRVVDVLGEELGGAFLDYSLSPNLTHKDHQAARVCLAEAIVTAMETGSHKEKVDSLSAVFLVIDQLRERVDQVQAGEKFPDNIFRII